MKLTWFGGRTLRVHIGGEILVTDPPAGGGEIVSGADRLIELDDPAIPIASNWQRRRAARLIDDEDEGVAVHRLGGAVLIDAVSEPPVLIATSQLAPIEERWVPDAVIVLFAGDPLPFAPRLIALAVAPEAVAGAIEDIRPHLKGAALIALEPGLAVEL